MDKKNSFKELNLIPKLLSALDKQGYTTPTPIQSKSIPDLFYLKKIWASKANISSAKTAISVFLFFFIIFFTASDPILFPP